MASQAPSDWHGHDPDVLDSLANERNGLAWQRTALSWFGSGAAVVRFFLDDGLITARSSIGYLMLLLGVFIWIDGSRRYHFHDRQIRDDAPNVVPEGKIRGIGYATTAVIFVIIVIELSDLS